MNKRSSRDVLGACASLVLAASAVAQPHLDIASSIPGTDYKVGREVLVDVTLSGLTAGQQLNLLGATLSFSGALLGTPASVTRGAAVPAVLADPTDFLSSLGSGTADASFATFTSNTAQMITGNGIFFRTRIVPIEAGVGSISFAFADARRFDGVTPGGLDAGVVAGGAFNFTVGYANETCPEATPIGDGAFSLANGLAGSSGPNEPACFGASDPAVNNDRWWRYTAPVPGTVKVFTCGASFDTRIVIYGNTCPAAPGLAIACNDDFCGTASSLFFNGNTGQQYLIRVGGRGAARGTGTLFVSGCPADLDDGSGTGTRDGGVTTDDLLYYLDQYTLGRLPADLDDGTGTGTRDGGITIDDLLYFLEAYAAGC